MTFTPMLVDLAEHPTLDQRTTGLFSVSEFKVRPVVNLCDAAAFRPAKAASAEATTGPAEGSGTPEEPDHASATGIRVRFNRDGSIANLAELGPLPEPREKDWCQRFEREGDVFCGHSDLMHAEGPCRGIDTRGEGERPCRCPGFLSGSNRADQTKGGNE